MNEQLEEIIENAEKIVFFGGAGVSTESSIPDFRSKDGLYNQKYNVPPEVMLSHTYFMNNTEDFFKFYRDKMLCLDAEPNDAHKRLAQLENEGKLIGVVTQNIDGLHQKAGSRRVFELHGSIHRNYCMKCHKFYDAEYIENTEGIPYCECGGIIKPDVVLYEESLDETTVENSVNAISSADVMIIAGTSLAVYPAAGLIRYFRGNKLVLINRDKTPADDECDLVIHEMVGETLKKNY